jgi:hypothetical protein
MTKLRLQFMILFNRFFFFIKEISSTNIEWLWISIKIISILKFEITNTINEIFLRYYKSYCSCLFIIYIFVFTRRHCLKLLVEMMWVGVNSELKNSIQSDVNYYDVRLFDVNFTVNIWWFFIKCTLIFLLIFLLIFCRYRSFHLLTWKSIVQNSYHLSYMCHCSYSS